MIKPKCPKCNELLVRLIYKNHEGTKYTDFNYCYHCKKLFKILLTFKEQKEEK